MWLLLLIININKYCTCSTNSPIQIRFSWRFSAPLFLRRCSLDDLLIVPTESNSGIIKGHLQLYVNNNFLVVAISSQFNHVPKLYSDFFQSYTGVYAYYTSQGCWGLWGSVSSKSTKFSRNVFNSPSIVHQ